jgi:hypothetical protein
MVGTATMAGTAALRIHLMPVRHIKHLLADKLHEAAF